MTEQEFVSLLKGFKQQTLTSEELELFFQQSGRPEYRALMGEAVVHDLENKTFASIIDAEVEQKVWQLVESEVLTADHSAETPPEFFKPAHRIHFLKTAWFKYAAAILIIFGAVAYLWINNHKGKELVTTNDNKRLQADIAPGGEKAVLTLADGSQIVLDSAGNGALVQQGNAQVVKLSNGQIAYNLQGQSGKEIMWNTMSTPPGGQYQVTLPDGTKVWLNASSSITFPTAFSDNKRQVSIKGEVYFEVTNDTKKPFVVDINGKSVVEVLGTSFNINSYSDEATIKTTLLTGSVKVSNISMTAVAGYADQQPDSSKTNNSHAQFAVLKPGQQAASGETIVVKSNVDMEQTLAWKNGLFNFNGLDLPVVMRQLERWYDIRVKYEGQVPTLIFRGEMYRSANLSDALGIFQKLGVKFRMEGKTLIVL